MAKVQNKSEILTPFGVFFRLWLSLWFVGLVYRLLSDLKFRLNKIRKRLAFLISASLFLCRFYGYWLNIPLVLANNA